MLGPAEIPTITEIEHWADRAFDVKTAAELFA